MPKYNPDTSHWDEDTNDGPTDDTLPVILQNHIIRVTDMRNGMVDKPTVEYTFHVDDNGIRGVSAETVSPNKSRTEFNPLNMTLTDVPDAVMDCAKTALNGNEIGACPDGITIQEHYIRVDDFRDNAADPRGMTYTVRFSEGDVSGVGGGHYFKDSDGTRITTQYDPMALSWNDVPAIVKTTINSHLNFSLQ